MKSIDDVDVKEKKVLVRADLDVPLMDGVVMDDTRIRYVLPTIRTLINKGASQIIIIGHLGRPKGFQSEFRLDPVAKKISQLLNLKVQKLDDCINIAAKGKIVLLENLRFYKEEVENDKAFAKQLASYADIYVNDAFAVSHRKHASVQAITEFLPSYAGLSLKKEIDILTSLRDDPERPFMVVLGGAKISTKLPIIKSLLKKVDKLFLGGAMIFTFYNALGYNIGKSLFEPGFEKECIELLKSNKLVLPKTVSSSYSLNGDGRLEEHGINGIPTDAYGVDIGLSSVKEFEKDLINAKTIFWNGPLGIFEVSKFAKSTNHLARFLSKKKTVIIGGGDTIAALNKLQILDYYHISSGGGSLLEFLAGKKLHGLN